jgi:hypothetical protein
LLLFKAMSIFVPIMVVGVGWLVTESINMRTQLATHNEWQRQTERDRFRKEDAFEMETRIQSEIMQIWKAIGDLPPQEVKDQIREQERRLDAVENIIAAMRGNTNG